jgi:hypothetical protein
MRRPPVAASTLTLLDDLLNGGVCRFQPSHGHQLRPPERLRRGLGAQRPDEQGMLAKAVSQVAQPVHDPAGWITPDKTRASASTFRPP